MSLLLSWQRKKTILRISLNKQTDSQIKQCESENNNLFYEGKRYPPNYWFICNTYVHGQELDPRTLGCPHNDMGREGGQGMTRVDLW